MMGVSWGALAGAFLAPFLYGLYWKGITKASVAVCYAWGTIIAVIQLLKSLKLLDMSGCGTFLNYIFKTSIHSGVIAMVGGLIIVPIISLLTRKMNKADVEEMFTCFEEKVEVAKKQSLE